MSRMRQEKKGEEKADSFWVPKSTIFRCPICRRVTPEEFQERHHLVPRSKKGREIVTLCTNCGDMLHRLFTNKELEKSYNTIEAILANEEVQKWASWVSKKENSFSVCMATKKRK